MAAGLWILLLAIFCVSNSALADAESPVGSTPAEWHLTDWMNSKPKRLSDLRGKVVLVRWWTAPNCNYCRATAPALNRFYKDYHDRGLEVVGVYHHKSNSPLKVSNVRKHAADLGFKFPVAIDRDWRTLKHWWLNDHDDGWTSVSFLIDHRGVIRHVHPGGSYVEGDADHGELKRMIEMLLRET